jgi:hypothetical protein
MAVSNILALSLEKTYHFTKQADLLLLRVILNANGAPQVTDQLWVKVAFKFY